MSASCQGHGGRDAVQQRVVPAVEGKVVREELPFAATRQALQHAGLHLRQGRGRGECRVREELQGNRGGIAEKKGSGLVFLRPQLIFKTSLLFKT